MFTKAFLQNGCLHELREGNVQLSTLHICGKILLKVYLRGRMLIIVCYCNCYAYEYKG